VVQLSAHQSADHLAAEDGHRFSVLLGVIVESISSPFRVVVDA